MKQRDLIKMTQDEVDEFLSGLRTMSMASINHDGTIHVVAMWYGFLEGSVAVVTKAKSQKVLNLRRDPRLTCMVEDGEAYAELRGVELAGRGEIVDDPDRMWELGVSVFNRYHGTYGEDSRPLVQAMLHKRVALKLHVDRVASWDHRKLGLAAGRPG